MALSLALLTNGARLRALIGDAAANTILRGAAEQLAPDEQLRKVPLGDGRVVLVDIDDENSDAAIRAAVEEEPR